MTPLESFKQCAESAYIDIAGCAEFRDPGVKSIGQMNRQSLIGAECWIDFRYKPRLRDLLVIAKVIAWIVRGTQCSNLELTQDSLSAQFRGRQQCIRGLPSGFRSMPVEKFSNAKVALQLKMRPVIERIPKRLRHSARPRQELLIRRCVSCTESLIYAMSSHCPPLIVVSFEPYFEEIFEPPILRDVLWRKMAVIVKDGLLLGISTKERLRGVVVQQKAIVNKRAHKFLRSMPIFK